MPLVAGEAAVCSIEHRESQQDYEKLAHRWIIRGFSLEVVERQARSCGRPQSVPACGPRAATDDLTMGLSRR